MSGNGEPDLLISNPLGDVQLLFGNGDGTFQPAQNLDQQVSLAVYAGNGTTPAAFIFSDQLTDQLIVQTVGGVTTVLGNAGTGLITPGAVKLADLNDNGILDLIVANSGSNNVLVYPGLGNGTFGPALNGGNGFFTGTNPVGITVADVNGDGRPDLIIANKGSNDVSILINEKVGSSFTFVPGPRLNAGIGPVMTAVADVIGNGVPDLVVANSGSNYVWVLQGIGNGFFNDQDPTIYPVGTTPSWLSVGQFTAGAGLDLVTVNSGSDNVTLISGLATGSPQVQTVSSGGVDPTAGFVAPLVGTNLDSLVVANNGDGNIALFQGGENGLTFTSVLSSPGLPNPSALALASFSASDMEFYAANDGEESASLLGFQLEETGALSSASSASALAAAPQLVSLNETSLALVGTLLTLTLELQNENESSLEGAAALVASGSGASAGQSLLGQSRFAEEFGDTGDATAPPGANPQNSWARFVIGLDQAIEKLRAEADERLRQEQEPANSQEPGTTLHDENDGARQTGAAAFLEHVESEAHRRLETDGARFRAIDVAIGSWAQNGPTTSKLPVPVIPGIACAKTPMRVPAFVEPEGRARLFPSVDNEHAERVAIPVSRVTAMVAISATTAMTGQILLRRSAFARRRPMTGTRS